MSGLDVADLLADAPAPDRSARRAVAARAERVIRPAGAFARLDEIAGWLASWQRTERPHVDAPAHIVFAADHGVASERVSVAPVGVTAAMVRAMREGHATAAVLARAVGASFSVVDVGTGRPTGNLAREPALDAGRFRSCFEAGRSAVRGLDADLLVLGEMGIGNTTAAAAVACSVFGMTAEDWTGRGTGIDDAALARKIDAVRRGCQRVGDVGPFDSLRELGGAELAALAGAAVEARLRSLPLVMDGFVVTAALAPLERISSGALDHCIAGHRSPEPGHALLLEKLGKEPVLDLGLRLGEGSGALAAVPLVRLAALAVTEVATFEDAGIDL